MTSFLTINDYINQAGGKVHNRPLNRVALSKTEASGENFAHLLKGLSSREKKPVVVSTRHLNLSDYRRQAIRVKTNLNRCKSIDAEAKQNTSTEASRAPDKPVQSEPSLPNRDNAGLETKTVTEILLKNEISEKPSDGVSDRQKIDTVINMAAQKYDLKPALIRAVIKAESDFNADVVSRAGAQGLMQLMPETAKELGVSNPFDIEQNIEGGARYLRQMIDQFNGNLGLALAAYNAGPGAVQRYQGIPPYEETIHYVQKVLKFSRQKV